MTERNDQNEKREWEEGLHKEAIPTSAELEDSAEQEQKKIGYFSEINSAPSLEEHEARYTRIEPPTPPRKNETKEESILPEALPTVLPKMTPSSEIIQSVQAFETLEQNEQSADQTIGEEAEEDPFEEVSESVEESVPPKKDSGWRKVALVACFPILSILFATAVMLFALARGDGANLPFAEEESTEAVTSQTGGNRVIFVKQYDDQSGLLTTPELYARYADTVVSILGTGKESSGVGSGFFLSEDGYIATAYHVVEGMESLTAVLSNGIECSASLVAGDALTDLALLKIDGEGYPTVRLGSSESLLTGERVIAIGTSASLDYAGSVCSGDISYGSRVVRIYDRAGVLEKKMKLIQTNAPVNPGNSGCPLFNEYGEVIGVITMRLGSDYTGIGFAIPIDGAMPILRAMMAEEPLDYEVLSAVGVYAPKLGIIGESASEGGILGVRVVDFSDEYGSASSILEKGDLIIQVDGTPVSDPKEISAVISEKNPDETVSVMVFRGGQRLTFLLTLGK